MYCGATLDSDAVAGAAAAAQRVLQAKSLLHLEAASPDRAEAAERRYRILETRSSPAERLAETFGVSLWDARQWQASSFYRLMGVSADPDSSRSEEPSATETVRIHSISERRVAARRSPVAVEAIDAETLSFSLREEAEGPAVRKQLRLEDLVLIVTAPIQREKIREQASPKKPADTKREENWLVHLHLQRDARPWEIDPGRTAYEGGGLASAHMRTRELVQRLSVSVPHDDAFKNMVPALSPGEDPIADLRTPKTEGRRDKDARVTILDNLTQFREYSAWRSALALSLASAGGGRLS